MSTIYCVIFAKNDDKFISVHHARNNDHAYGFLHALKSVATGYRGYMFPRDHDLAARQETPDELKSAKLAISIDKSRRAKKSKGAS